MSNKKNIDRLFQEKFKDFETFPEKDLWTGIEARLDEIPATRKPAAMWWKLGGIAATVILLLSLGLNSLFHTPSDIPEDPLEKVNTVQQTGTDQDPPAQTQDDDNTAQTQDDAAAQTQDAETQDAQSNDAGTHDGGGVETHDYASLRDDNDNTNDTNNDAETQNQQVSGNTEGDTVVQTQNVKSDDDNTDNPTTRKNDLTPADDEEEAGKKSLLTAIAEMEQEQQENDEDRINSRKNGKKWSLSPNVAPVYYNSVSGGSPIDPEFSGNSKSGKVNISYGVNVAYEVNNRLSFRSGVNKVNYGYNTNDISFSPNFEARALTNVNYARQSDVASAPLVSSKNDSKSPPMSSREEIAATFSPQEGNMQQEFGYIEVPMELKYRLIDHRFGLNVIGGISSLFLTNNSILLKSDNLATELGEANNVNDVNFSTNVGLGVDYLLSDKLRLQVEPMFKYQLNTFSGDSGGFRPYSFGVYTGFSFRF
ncbi:porin family protein [Sinomicrobium soli]|uniref:outer membrane beta-barrel protein n=1 Tax=Sinomicrobium sp. N-1-3-6 TaxID=2219864 RepID=UPI000DCC11FB|nr:outer membrane beta-barrel protein [Sinomicrobium sp. N-1-3-6]RAV28294.1 hypothetical protein DN748_14130 [Sinomicrobium sp. N-1-3-6]